MTIEELQKQFDDYKKQMEEQVNALKLQVEEEKKKNFQMTLQATTKKVEPQKEEEPVEFDFTL